MPKRKTGTEAQHIVARSIKRGEATRKRKSTMLRLLKDWEKRK